MYAVQIIIVITTVYLAPALLLRPALLLKPQTSVAIPFVSVFIVFLLQTALVGANLYTPAIVQFCSGLMLVIALVRVAVLLREHSIRENWGEFPRLLLLLNLALCLYFGAMLLVHGFDTHDEIYSWNMWAIQHYLGEDIDYYYTNAPYPQLFPRLLSFCYMVLGNIESQTAVKTALIVFPFTIFTALGLVSRGNQRKYLVLHLLLCLILLREVGLKDIFDDGMPDTMAAAAVLLSAYFILLYRQQRQSAELIWLSLVCAVVAVLAKQHALVWGLFSLPAIALIDKFRSRETWTRTQLMWIPAVCGIAWILTEGKNFQDNPDVLTRSFDGRNLLEQLWFSVDRYLIQEPSIALLLVLAMVSVIRARRGYEIFLLFVAPSFVIWWLFAAYDLRAGTPSLLALGLLIAQGNYCLGSRDSAAGTEFPPLSSVVKYTLVFLLLAVSFGELWSKVAKVKSNDDYYVVGFSQRNNLITLFAADAPVVYEEIVNNAEARLWAPSNYIYGMVYGSVDVTRPDYGTAYDAGRLLDELKMQNRTHAASAGSLAFGPGSGILEELATRKCPELFTLIAGPDNAYGVKLYRINAELLSSEYCDL